MAHCKMGAINMRQSIWNKNQRRRKETHVLYETGFEPKLKFEKVSLPSVLNP